MVPGSAPPSDLDRLTSREREVLRLVALGLSNRDAARLVPPAPDQPVD